MMDYEYILNNIRRLSAGKNITDTGDAAGLINVLEEHSCQYLLSQINGSNVNSAVIKARLALNKRIISERYCACRELFDTLNENGIKYVVYKGAVLSERAYGDTAFRFSGDIDILASRGQTESIKAILKSCGYMQGHLAGGKLNPYTRSELLYHTAFTHQLAPFMKEVGEKYVRHINVDVNTDIFWGESGITGDMDGFLSNSSLKDIGGTPVSVLNPVYDFIAVCMHHYKDLNSLYLLSRSRPRLSHFCDIYFYIKNNREYITPESLRNVCKAYGVDSYVYYCLYYAYEVFGDPMLTEYINIVRTEEALRLIDCFGLNDKERRTWNMDFRERLLDSDYSCKFNEMLNAEDKNKININGMMMK